MADGDLLVCLLLECGEGADIYVDADRLVRLIGVASRGGGERWTPYWTRGIGFIGARDRVRIPYSLFSHTRQNYIFFSFVSFFPILPCPCPSPSSWRLGGRLGGLGIFSWGWGRFWGLGLAVWAASDRRGVSAVIFWGSCRRRL